SANDPLNSATRITKTGKYYNMNRAVSTKNDLHNEIPKQEVSKIKVEKIKQKEQKNVNKSSDKKLSSEENSNNLFKLNIPIDLRDYVRNEKYLSKNIKSLEDYSSTKIDISHNYDKIIIIGSNKNIGKVLNLL